LGWLLITSSPQAVCVGASGAIFGVLAGFATLYPNRRITLLVFFVLPVTMKAWVLATVLMGVDLLYMLGSQGGGVAHAAHLGGGLAGYIYTSVVFRKRLFGFGISVTPPRPRPGPGAGKRAGVGQAEVDRILDKIAAQGIGSLTRGERDLLEKASRDKRAG
jgi:hypothetical protein